MAILAIDQGTTNSRAIIFDNQLTLLHCEEIPLQQSYPQPGWVEQDAEEMFANSLECCIKVLKTANLSASDVIGIGISNQRETTIIWDKKTGKPIYPAIVWQDRRTSELCRELSQHAIASTLQQKTGLLLDPYFSATKIMWILDNVKDARARAERSELLFGTVDCYLLWQFTEGKVHATDITNAARTLLFNIREQCWDKEILAAFNIPENLLPTVLDNAADFGSTRLIGEASIAISGMAGDQQAATIGQACFTPGEVKMTFGTGGFMVLNTGDEIVYSTNQLLSTVAYRVKNKITYALEGGFFAAGVTIKWLRDTLKIIHTAAETEQLAAQLDSNHGVYLVPAFTGLGAPYWQPDVRAAIFGMTRGTDATQLSRAALESVVYQTRDLLEAMRTDYPHDIKNLYVDGGMAANNWLLQFLADMLNIHISRPDCIESSARGAAVLVGLQHGIFTSLDDIKKHYQADRVFESDMDDGKRQELYKGWKNAISRLCGVD